MPCSRRRDDRRKRRERRLEPAGRVILFVLGVLFWLPPPLFICGFRKNRTNAVRIHAHGIVLHKTGKDRLLTSVVLSKTETVEGLIHLLSNREALLALCHEMIAKNAAPIS